METIKGFKRFMREVGGKQRTEGNSNGAGPPQEGIKQEGKDVTDKEMASALGKRELGQGTGEGGKAKSGTGSNKKGKKQEETKG